MKVEEDMDRVLTADRVNRIAGECITRDEIESIHAVGHFYDRYFQKEKIDQHRDEIIAMLGELPDGFKRGKGGGWHFSMALLDKHGNQWVDLHSTIEELFLLGIAVGKVEKIPMEFYVVTD